MPWIWIKPPKEKIPTSQELTEFVQLNPPSHQKPCDCPFCRVFGVNQENTYMTCCAFGPCDNSIEMGGSGCDICDRVAKLPEAHARRQQIMPDAQHAMPKKRAKQQTLKSCDA